MHIRRGLEANFTVKTAKIGSPAPPEPQPSPAKAGSVYTGAGPIRARYNAGYANLITTAILTCLWRMARVAGF